MILSTNTIVSPNAVSLKSINTFITNVAMVRSWSFDHLAVRANVFSRDYLKQMHHVEFVPSEAINDYSFINFFLSKFEETRIVSRREDERHHELQTNQGCSHHEVPDVKFWLDNEHLSKVDHNEQNQEKNLSSSASFEWHNRKSTKRTTPVAWFLKDLFELLNVIRRKLFSNLGIFEEVSRGFLLIVCGITLCTDNK